MAVILGSASGVIEIDASRVKSGAAAAAAAMEGVSRAGREMGASLGLVARDAKSFESDFQGVGLVLSGVAAASSALIVTSVKTAARTEELGYVLNALAKNARTAATENGNLALAEKFTEENVWKTVAAVKAKGITTQVATGLTAQFARYTLDLSKATDLARVSQDAAVLSMENSSDNLNGLIYGITTYNQETLRTHGINVNMQKAFDATAASLGKTREELTESEKVNAAMNAVLQEGTRIAGTYESAMDSAGKRLRSLDRYVEETKNNIGAAFLPAMGSAVDGVTGLLKAFNDLSPAQRQFASESLAATAAVTGAAGAFILLTPKIIESYGTMVKFAAYGKDVVTGLQLMKAGFTASEVATTGFAGATAAALPVVLALTLAIVAAYKAYELHQQVQERTKEVGTAYAQMLRDQVDAGKSAENIMAEYAATQEQVNKMYEVAPWYLKPFIDKQSLVTAGAKEYVKILGESDLAQSEYEAEMRKAASSMGLEVDEAGNLIRVTQAMGAVNREVVQTNYMMSESQRRVAQAMKETSYTAVEQLRAQRAVEQSSVQSSKALKDEADALKAAAEKADELRDAQAGLADETLSVARSFADGNAKYTERADLTRQLADLDAEIIKNGPAHLGLIKARTMSEAELKKEQGALLYLGQELGTLHRNQGETDIQLAARTDELTKKYNEYKTEIGEATGVIGAHTGMVGGATKAQQEERQAILDKIAAMDLEIQKEMAQQAVESLTPEMFGTGAAAATAYAAAKRDLMLATGLVTKESLAEKDSIDILTGALAAGQITPAQYALALRGIKGAASDGQVSLRELTGSITSLSGTKFSMKNMDDVRRGIVDPLKGAKADAIAAGADISAGLGQGVASNTVAFSGSLKGVVDAGVLGLLTAYQMHSPSLVMAGLGVDFLQGLTNGVVEGRAILEPEIVATGALFTNVLQPTFVATAAMLNGLVVPSFQAVADVIGKTVIPQGKDLDKFIKDEMSKVLQSLRDDQLVPTAGAFGGVAAMASIAEEAIRGAARAASSFRMPNFGSPGGGGSSGGTPSYAYGGDTGRGGLARLHPNEFVLTEEMRRGLQPIPVEAFYPEVRSRAEAPSEPVGGGYGNRVTIYGGLTLSGVQDARSLLAELQAMS